MFKIYCTEQFSQLGLAKYLPDGFRVSKEQKFKTEDDGFGTAAMSDPVNEVGWNKSIVSDTPTLFTDDIGPCIAVLAKASNSSEGKTYYGITHIFSDVGLGVCSSMLEQIADKTNRAAMTVYINGGRPCSAARHASLLSLIKKQDQHIEIAQDLFSLLKHQFSASNAKNTYLGLIEISQTGFQEDGTPYVIYDSQIECFSGKNSTLTITY